MTDTIQDALLALVDGQRGPRVDEGLDALAREWRPRIRRLLQAPSADEVEAALAAAMLALVVERSESTGKPRALAPADAESPRAWRRRVLQNHLISELRKDGRRRHADRAVSQGLSPEAEHEAWRENKQERERIRWSPGAPESTPSLSEPHTAAAPEPQARTAPALGMQRRAVWAVLPQLSVSRAVMVVFAMNGDPSPFAEPLAHHLSEPPEPVLRRIRYALVAPPDHVHDYLTMAEVRVPWPTAPDAKALDSARKALQRGIADVRKALARQAEAAP